MIGTPEDPNVDILRSDVSVHEACYVDGENSEARKLSKKRR